MDRTRVDDTPTQYLIKFHYQRRLSIRRDKFVLTLESGIRDSFDIPRIRSKVSDAAKRVGRKSNTQGFREFDLQGKSMISQHRTDMSPDQV